MKYGSHSGMVFEPKTQLVEKVEILLSVTV